LAALVHDWLAQDSTEKATELAMQILDVLEESYACLKRALSIVVDTPTDWARDAMETHTNAHKEIRSSKALGFKAQEVWHHWSGDGSEPKFHTWSIPAKVFRTSPLTMSQLLWDLRALFREPEFMEQYSSLRKRIRPGEPELIELALTVQRRVLPQYGFPGSVKGVTEMRAEVQEAATDEVSVPAVFHTVSQTKCL